MISLLLDERRMQSSKCAADRRDREKIRTKEQDKKGLKKRRKAG